MTKKMTMMTSVQVCVLCGPQPSLAELDRLIVKSWRPAMPHLAALQVSHFPASLHIIQHNLLGFNLRGIFLPQATLPRCFPPSVQLDRLLKLVSSKILRYCTPINIVDSTTYISLSGRSLVFCWSTLIGNECLLLCFPMDQTQETQPEHLSNTLFNPSSENNYIFPQSSAEVGHSSDFLPNCGRSSSPFLCITISTYS